MLLQIGTRGKFLGAVGAFEGLISRVDTLMPDQIRHLRERLGAARVVAWVWLLLIVNSRVLLKRRVLRKGLVTGLAKKYKNYFIIHIQNVGSYLIIIGAINNRGTHIDKCIKTMRTAENLW